MRDQRKSPEELDQILMENGMEVLLEEMEESMPQIGGFDTLGISFCLRTMNPENTAFLDVDEVTDEMRCLKASVVRNGTDRAFPYSLLFGSSEKIKAFLKKEDSVAYLIEKIESLSTYVDEYWAEANLIEERISLSAFADES